ncbi:hypothetical protein [Streptomyces sp. CB01881]|uniref:hypothetical protein n=1 Tax=Streptomyces sp. CB01881 TaxID=2078691 RepID=UPI000CDBA731|nr:hypothetical protein [Streptomyces sp. CB01881]AUY51074.1 hypothetical protein C2142_21410 [Streptomyces sp. CB01881]TYC74458.1 hypothetical protein EH183_21380 [Streptomyces sp. CB01881]
MRTGTASFLVGAAFAALLALALATVALGVVTALKVNGQAHAAGPPAPITRHGRWELRRLPDGTHEYAWIARQAGHYGPELPPPPTTPGRHRSTPGTTPGPTRGRHRIPG